MKRKLNQFLLDERLLAFLKEDIEHGDITSEAVFTTADKAKAMMVARQDMIACGFAQVAARVFSLLGEVICCRAAVDGHRYRAGDSLLAIEGSVLNILAGERVALNLAQRLCGIATLTASYVEAVQGLPVRITDTRKTMPGLRLLDKYGVRCGGGFNHRYSLSDTVLLKDNHIAACGSIGKAVAKIRKEIPHTIKVEVECDTIEQVKECLACEVDIIMLDNMRLADLQKGVEIINGKAVVEASGGVNINNVRQIAQTGVDIISVGALTHSVTAVDIGLDWVS